MEIKNIGISPPWMTYYEKVKAMLGQDSEITIGDINSIERGYKFSVFVQNTVKAEAIKLLLIPQIVFGNVSLQLTVIGPDGNEISPADPNIDTVELLHHAFDNNPLFVNAIDRQLGPSKFVYCIFAKKIIQFFNDDLSDYKGNCSILPSDIAKQIFKNSVAHFCISAK